MIQPSHLRIGNYVMDSASGEWMTVDEIGESVGAVLLNRDKYPLPKGWQMEYIPLTPDILEICGFEKDEIFFVAKEFFKIMATSEEPYCFEFEYNSEDVYPKKAELKYLHELQNLAFALTGKELKIKQLEHAEK